jgi:hypothetical protein
MPKCFLVVRATAIGILRSREIFTLVDECDGG